MTNQEWADKTAEEIAGVLEANGIEVTEVRGAVITAQGVQILSDALLRALQRMITFTRPEADVPEEEITTDNPCPCLEGAE